jgi:RNA-binding protein
MLTNHQKRHLKALAHAIRPVVIIGSNGLTEAVTQEIDHALGHHELLKIRINAADRTARQHIVTQITTRLGTDLVQQIGHVAIVFRRNPEAPRISLD